MIPDPTSPGGCGVRGRLRVLVDERRGVEHFTQRGQQAGQALPHGRVSSTVRIALR